MTTRRGAPFSAAREPGNDQKNRQSIGIGCQAAAGAGLLKGAIGGNRECYRTSAVFIPLGRVSGRSGMENIIACVSPDNFLLKRILVLPASDTHLMSCYG